MKRSLKLILVLSLIVLGGLSFSCKQEGKKDAAGTESAAKQAESAAKQAGAAEKQAGDAEKVADEAAKVADVAAKVSAAHNPDSADHVPCGAHGSGEATADGPRHPSVFKTMPALGTKISCPIKGETFEFSQSRPTHEYNGKIYVFGCNGCKSLFLKDPEVALKKYTFTEAP